MKTFDNRYLLSEKITDSITAFLLLSILTVFAIQIWERKKFDGTWFSRKQIIMYLGILSTGARFCFFFFSNIVYIYLFGIMSDDLMQSYAVYYFSRKIIKAEGLEGTIFPFFIKYVFQICLIIFFGSALGGMIFSLARDKPVPFCLDHSRLIVHSLGMALSIVFLYVGYKLSTKITSTIKKVHVDENDTPKYNQNIIFSQQEDLWILMALIMCSQAIKGSNFLY